MDQSHFGPRRGTPPIFTPASPTPHASRDDDASPSSAPADVAAPSRHRFTLFVEDVASTLNTYGIDRDVRTIQRWCKSGKLQAITDHANGEKYRIDPASLQTVIDDILAAQAEHPRPGVAAQAATTRPGYDSDAAPMFTPRHTSDKQAQSPDQQPDTGRDSSSDDASPDATSQDKSDTVATMQRQLKELEKERDLLKVDKRVREEMVAYLKTQFEDMVNTSLDNSQKIGQLKAENEYLKAMLPSGQQPPFLAADPYSSPSGRNDVHPGEEKGT